MTDEEILLRRLHGQFLLAPGGVRKVARGLCGLQAQFFSNALHALRIRCGHEPAESELAPLCKTWTIRGTIHLIDRDDLPLFLHEGRERFAPVRHDGGRRRVYGRAETAFRRGDS